MPFFSKNHLHQHDLIHPPPNFTEVGIIGKYHFSHCKYSEGSYKNVMNLAEITQRVKGQVKVMVCCHVKVMVGKDPGR